jgi:hypothetical protein
MMRTVFLFLGLSLLMGCVHTTVTQGAVSVNQGPYQKILICSLSDDAARAVLMEEALSKQLQKNHVATQTCSSFMVGPPESDSAVLSRIRKEGFDAVLVLQRDVVSREVPPVGSLITQTNMTSLEGFVQAFHAMAAPRMNNKPVEPGTVEPSFFVKERIISGKIILLSVAQDRLVWAGAGTVAGPAKKPIQDFIESVASRTDHDLAEAHMIPRRFELP